MQPYCQETWRYIALSAKQDTHFYNRGGIVRHLAAILAAILIVGTLCLSIGLPRSFASNGHNCAPSTPPLIPGTLVNPAAIPGTLFINEVLLQPHSIWNCSETGGYFTTRDAWVELYNPQNQPLNLYAVHAFVDMGSSIGNYYLPFGAAIAAHGFLVLFPFYSPTFRATTSITFRLVIGTTVIDQVVVPPLGPDQSYARTYDGGPGWQITAAPTIDANNGTNSTTPMTPVSQRGGGGSTATPGASNSAIANGTQPAWGKLQLPGTVATTATTLTPITKINFTPTTLVTPGPSTNGGLDTLHRIALTLIFILLMLVLFACWKWKLYKFRS